MGSDMVGEAMQPFQIENDDYVQLEDTSGEKHIGTITNIEDMGDVFLVTMIDDEDGDSVTYEIDADSTVNLLVYEQIAV
jgi:hypothetical protein